MIVTAAESLRSAMQRLPLAAILVLVFGQQIEDVAALTWDKASVSSELV